MKDSSTIAGCVLTATAFILAAMIFVVASQRMQNSAHAEMVVNKGTVTMVATQFRTDSEIVYVLDSRGGRLLAYMHDPNQRVINMLPGGVMNIEREFALVFRNTRSNDDGDRDRRRSR